MMNRKSSFNSHNLFLLFFSFLKIGAFTFGGGYAMIALIRNEFVEKRKWMTSEEFMDMVAIAESTPGPIAINSATYIGYKVGGIIGGALATIAVCLPSFVIIYTISLFLDKFLENRYIACAFKGIQVCVAYLVLSAGLKMAKSLKKNVFNMTILVSVTVIMTCFTIFAVKVSSIVYILAGAVAGISAFFFAKRGKKH